MLLDVVGCCWMLLDVVGRCWVLLDVVGCCWVLLDVVGCCWMLLGWMSLDLGGCCWTSNSIHPRASPPSSTMKCDGVRQLHRYPNTPHAITTAIFITRHYNSNIRRTPLQQQYSSHAIPRYLSGCKKQSGVFPARSTVLLVVIYLFFCDPIRLFIGFGGLFVATKT